MVLTIVVVLVWWSSYKVDNNMRAVLYEAYCVCCGRRCIAFVGFCEYSDWVRFYGFNIFGYVGYDSFFDTNSCLILIWLAFITSTGVS